MTKVKKEKLQAKIKEIYKVANKAFKDGALMLDESGITDAIEKAISEAQQQAREEIREIIKDSGPDLVFPIKELPFREDYINKWKLLDILSTKPKL